MNNDNPFKLIEAMVVTELQNDENITTQAIDRTKLDNPGNLYVDLMQFPNVIAQMTNYELYANIHFNVVAYGGYMVNLYRLLGDEQDSEAKLAEFQKAIFDFTLTLNKDFDALSDQHWANVKTFMYSLQERKRLLNAAKNLHDLAFEPLMHRALAKALRSDLAEIIGHLS